MNNNIKSIEITATKEIEVENVAGKVIEFFKITSNEEYAAKLPITVTVKDSTGKRGQYIHAHGDFGPNSTSLLSAPIIDCESFGVPKDAKLFLQLDSVEPETKSAKATISYRLS